MFMAARIGAKAICGRSILSYLNTISPSSLPRPYLPTNQIAFYASERKYIGMSQCEVERQRSATQIPRTKPTCKIITPDEPGNTKHKNITSPSNTQICISNSNKMNNCVENQKNVAKDGNGKPNGLKRNQELKTKEESSHSNNNNLLNEECKERNYIGMSQCEVERQSKMNNCVENQMNVVKDGHGKPDGLKSNQELQKKEESSHSNNNNLVKETKEKKVDKNLSKPVTELCNCTKAAIAKIKKEKESTSLIKEQQIGYDIKEIENKIPITNKELNKKGDGKVVEDKKHKKQCDEKYSPQQINEKSSKKNVNECPNPLSHKINKNPLDQMEGVLNRMATKLCDYVRMATKFCDYVKTVYSKATERENNLLPKVKEKTDLRNNLPPKVKEKSDLHPSDHFVKHNEEDVKKPKVRHWIVEKSTNSPKECKNNHPPCFANKGQECSQQMTDNELKPK